MKITIVDRFVLLFLFLGLYLFPFYIFESGSLQPSHACFIVFGVLFFMLKLKGGLMIIPEMKQVYFALLCFVGVTIMVSIAYTMSQARMDALLFAAFYIFNSFIFISCVWALVHYKETGFKLIFWFVTLTVFTQVTLFLLGIVKPSSRVIIFFNNPNQLGYFALMGTGILTTTAFAAKSLKKYLFIGFSLSGYLCYLSLSRAATSGFLLYVLFLVLVGKMRWWYKIALTTVIVAATAWVMLNQNSLTQDNERAAALAARSSRSENVAEVRGYDRFTKFPEYFIYGASERNEYLSQFYENDFHSTLGNIWFCYGILGLSCFLFFAYSVLKNAQLLFICFQLPVWYYGLTHNGIKPVYFWFFLALTFATAILLPRTKTHKFRYSLNVP